MSNLSAVIAGGQTISFSSGSGAIPANALVQVGGPGPEAWPVVTTDHAALSAQQVIAPVPVAGGGATNNYARLASANCGPRQLQIHAALACQYLDEKRRITSRRPAEGDPGLIDSLGHAS